MDAFEEDAEAMDEPSQTPVEGSVAEFKSTHEETAANPLEAFRSFLDAVLAEDVNGQRMAASKLGKLIDAVAEEINELTVDVMGDVLLEDGDSGYRVIDDYRDWLNEALQTPFGKEL